MSLLRTIRLVAGFELYESLRSRKALALMLIYVVVAVGGCAFFIYVMNEVMSALKEKVGQEGIDLVLKDERLVKEIAGFVKGDQDLAREILSVPPLALFYLWFANTFMPLVVALTSSDAIASEVSSGSVRYALFRVDRLGWALGKLAGQAMLMVVGIAVGALTAWVMGLAMLDSFAPGATLWWLLRMSARASVYGFAYLGIAFCASQLVRGPWAARGIGLVLAFACSLFGGIMDIPRIRKASPDLTKVLSKLVPNGHSLDLFRPDIIDRTVAMGALVFIGGTFFALGFLRFRSRDA